MTAYFALIFFWISAKKKQKASRLVFFASSIVLCVWLANWFLVPLFLHGSEQGIFGDKFGAVNSLFTGLTVIGLIYTIYLQIQSASVQQFDTTFFRLLDEVSTAERSLSYKDPNYKTEYEINSVDWKGVDCFQLFRDFIPTRYSLSPEEFDSLQSNYVYCGYQRVFESYHIRLAILVQYIDDAKFLGEEEKRHYLNMIIMPMSFIQKFGLFAHIGLSANHAQTVYDKILIGFEKKYQLLQDVDSQRYTIAGTDFPMNFLFYAGIHDKQRMSEYELEGDVRGNEWAAEMKKRKAHQPSRRLS